MIYRHSSYRINSDVKKIGDLILKNKRGNEKGIDFVNIIWLIPLILVVVVVPLMVILTPVDVLDIERVLWNDTDVSNDFFNMGKSRMFIIAVSILFVITVFRWLVHDIQLKWHNSFIPLLAFGLLALVSTVFKKYEDFFTNNYQSVVESPSEHFSHNIAIRGFWDRYEGIYVLLGYILVAILIHQVITSFSQMKFLINSLIVSSTIIALIGIFQYIGYDFFRTPLGVDLMVPEQYDAIKEHISFNFGKFTSYSTLYNPNYVGGYMALVLPVSVAALFSGTSRLENAMYGFSTLSLAACLFTSNSLTGQVAGLLSLAFMFVLGFDYFRKHMKKIAAISVLFLLIYLILNISTGFRHLESILGTEIIAEEDIIDNSKPYVAELSKKQELVTSIDKIDNGVTVQTESTTIGLKVVDGQLFFLDSEGNPMNTLMDAEKQYFEDERYNHMSFMFLGSNEGLKLWIGRKTIDFYFNGNSIEVVGPGGRLYSTDYEVATLGFEGRELFGNSRGYIWSRSLPMLKETMIVGVGADAYAAAFPQQDIMGKINYLFRSAVLVDKAHNWYLQTAINTGVLSLLLLLGLFAYTLIRYIIYVIKQSSWSNNQIITLGLVGATASYLISGIGNDSVIGISSVFWVLFAMLMIQVNGWETE